MLQVLPNGWPEGNRAAPYVHFIGQNVAQSAISVNGDISIYPDKTRKAFSSLRLHRHECRLQRPGYGAKMADILNSETGRYG